MDGSSTDTRSKFVDISTSTISERIVLPSATNVFELLVFNDKTEIKDNAHRLSTEDNAISLVGTCKMLTCLVVRGFLGHRLIFILCWFAWSPLVVSLIRIFVGLGLPNLGLKWPKRKKWTIDIDNQLFMLFKSSLIYAYNL